MGLGRVLASGAVIGGVAIFGGVQAFDDETTRDEAGRITEAGGLGAFVVRVGDCIQLPDAQNVASVEGVPCEDPHDAEAYATFELSLPEFDESLVGAGSDEGCLARWQDAIGTVYEDDPYLDMTSFIPTPESWAEGDREVVCFVTSLDGSPLQGSRRR